MEIFLRAETVQEIKHQGLRLIDARGFGTSLVDWEEEVNRGRTSLCHLGLRFKPKRDLFGRSAQFLQPFPYLVHQIRNPICHTQ